MENSLPIKALLWHLQILKLSLLQMLKKQYDCNSFVLADLAERIKVNLDICLSRPPQYTIKPGSPQLGEVRKLQNCTAQNGHLLEPLAKIIMQVQGGDHCPMSPEKATICMLCHRMRSLQVLVTLSEGHSPTSWCQVVNLRKSIEEDQRLLVQWAEERMSLACIMSDLLDMHVIQLDKDLQGLESELEVKTISRQK